MTASNTSETSPTVCTVILNWNQPLMTVDCASSTLTQEVVGGNVVLIVDNGSSTENLTTLKESLPAGCSLIESDCNLGFAGGMNLGIKHALDKGCNYVWLLNNDAFPRIGCLQALVSRMNQDTTLGAVTPRLFYADGSDHPVGAKVDWSDGSHVMLTCDNLSQPTNCVGTTAIGTALLVRSATIKQIGMLDARFFMYREEDDLCARITKAGYYLAAVPSAECVHLERASTGGGASPFVCHLLTRNTFLLLRNQLPSRWRIPAILRLIANSLGSAAGYSQRDTSLGSAVIGGVWAGLWNEQGKPKRLNAPHWFERIITWRWYTVSRMLRLAAKTLHPRRDWHFDMRDK